MFELLANINVSLPDHLFVKWYAPTWVGKQFLFRSKDYISFVSKELSCVVGTEKILFCATEIFNSSCCVIYYKGHVVHHGSFISHCLHKLLIYIHTVTGSLIQPERCFHCLCLIRPLEDCENISRPGLVDMPLFIALLKPLGCLLF